MAVNKKDKLIKRFKTQPRDFTFDEVVTLFQGYGFELENKGSTSGSRVKFYNAKDKNSYIMHKPHPSNIYTGSVEYSEEDKCLFGKVQGMAKDSITYEGSTVEELTEDFEGAVDDYLALCEEKGIEPRKPYSGVLNVRLTPEIHSSAAMAAQKAGITINAFIKNAVARALGIAL